MPNQVNLSKKAKTCTHYGSGSQPVVRVPLVVRKGLQGGTRDPSVLLHKKNTFRFQWWDLLINSCIFVYFPY